MSTQPSQSADIAILVALEKELDAVLHSAGSWERHQTSSDIRTYYTSTTPAGLSVVAVRSSGMGQINAALLARDVVALFKPRKVILVGIAAGLGKEVSLGDIVVSDRIVDYEIGKVTPSGTTPRWSVYGSDALLRERLLLALACSDGPPGWREERTANDPLRGCPLGKQGYRGRDSGWHARRGMVASLRHRDGGRWHCGCA